MVWTQLATISDSCQQSSTYRRLNSFVKSRLLSECVCKQVLFTLQNCPVSKCKKNKHVQFLKFLWPTVSTCRQFCWHRRHTTQNCLVLSVSAAWTSHNMSFQKLLIVMKVSSDNFWELLTIKTAKTYKLCDVIIVWMNERMNLLLAANYYLPPLKLWPYGGIEMSELLLLLLQDVLKSWQVSSESTVHRDEMKIKCEAKTTRNSANAKRTVRPLRNIKGKPQIFGSFPSPRPRPLFLWLWFLWWALANPSCTPNLKLIASAVVQILKGNPKMLGSSYSTGPHPLFLQCGILWWALANSSC